jgi:hypothetical protein
MGGTSNSDPSVRLVSQSTMQIGGEKHAFDDSKARTIFVDLVTEGGAANGIVCIGLGHLISPVSGNPHAEGDVHLRMSVPMAASVIEALSGAMRKASEQQTLILKARKSN